MTPRTILSLSLLAALTTGCGPDFEVRIAGEVDGMSFTTVTAFWGGPFVVFTDQPMDCEDMFFVTKFNEDGDEPLVEYDMRMLQLTYNDSDVVTGNYDFGGEAPVTAEFIDITGGAMTVHRATEGTLAVDSADSQELGSGEFQIAFEENNEDLGALAGDFLVPWCTNLVSRY